MDSNKGLLVPIMYNGQWIKREDGCWTYDSSIDTRYARAVRSTTTYDELVDIICTETGINRDENIVEVRGWVSYPVKEVIGPFRMMKDIDITTFFDLNSSRSIVAPLCITTSPKVKVVTASQTRHASPPKVPISKSKSVNQPKDEEGIKLNETFGLDYIQLSNQVDHVHEEEDEESSCDFDDYDNISHDPFDYEPDEDNDDGCDNIFNDPFDYEPDEEKKNDDSHARRDPSHVDLDDYFHVYVETPTMPAIPQENEGWTPPKSEIRPCAQEFSVPPCNRQEYCPPLDRNTRTSESTSGDTGIKRSRGRPQGKAVPSDAQSSNAMYLMIPTSAK